MKRIFLLGVLVSFGLALIPAESFAPTAHMQHGETYSENGEPTFEGLSCPQVCYVQGSLCMYQGMHAHGGKMKFGAADYSQMRALYRQCNQENSNCRQACYAESRPESYPSR